MYVVEDDFWGKKGWSPLVVAANPMPPFIPLLGSEPEVQSVVTPTVAPAGLPVREADQQELDDAIRGSATALTVSSHLAKGLPIFRQFLEEDRGYRTEQACYDLCLRDKTTKVAFPLEQQIQILAGYVRWLRQHKLGIASHVAALKFCWEREVADMRVFSKRAFRHVIADSGSKQVKARERAEQAIRRECKSMTEESIRRGCELFMSSTRLNDFASITHTQWDDTMAWVAGLLSFHLSWRTAAFGRRGSTPSAKKAAAAVADTRAWAGVSEEERVSDLLNAGLMRAEDVGFSIGEKGTSGALKFVDTREFARKCREDVVCPLPVKVSLILKVYKTDRMGAKPLRAIIGSSGELETRLVRAMACIAERGQHASGETPFFSRPAVSASGSEVVVLLAKRITSVAKAAAKDVGMNEGTISAKSFKMGFVTQNYEAGMSAAESAVATGHKSAEVNKRYRATILSKSGGALLALDSADGGPRFSMDASNMEDEAFRAVDLRRSTRRRVATTWLGES